MTALYGIVSAAAFIMLGVYFYIDRKRDIWLMLLFVSVAVCDLGYFLLSVSKTLEMALWANRIAYLGSVFLVYFILMMIMNLSRFAYPKFLPRVLIAVNTIMLLIAVSGGILPVYYKSVDIAFIDGAAVLVKEYGFLHITYKIYLFAYFAAMIGIILYTAVKKTVISSKHSIFLAFVVIGNIAIWLVENLLDTDFEFLSISYIVTEGLILFLYGILQDYGLADTQKIVEASVKPISYEAEMKHTDVIKSFKSEQIDCIFEKCEAIETLSQREKEVLRFILLNKKRKDIAEELFVTESTIKKHTSGIFHKLEVTSRTELFDKVKMYVS